MAVYTYISGLESDIVGLYANELLSSLATRTIGSFTRNTAAGLFAFISSEERRTYVYEPSLIDLYNELDYGFINTAYQSTLNHGNISDSTATAEDYGRIYYVSNVESFGFVKFVSEASWKATQAWEGSGNIGLYGKEQSPAFYNYITSNRLRGLEGSSGYAFSPALQSGGGLSLLGESQIGISLRIIIDASTLFSFSGLDERKTFDYPATEGSLSILGGVSDVDTTFAYFAEGILFNFSGLDEKVSYDYQGSGKLFGFNNLEEARVYRYDCHDSNAIDYFVESDYGYIERCITTETITGDISGSSTSCKCVVQQGSTARIVDNQSYSVSLNSDIATTFVDYGYITNPADALLDFGYILTTSNVMPCGSIRFNKEIASSNKFTPNWNGEGIISISGASRIPLDVAVYGTGFIKNLGGSAETAAFAEETKDLFRVTGDATIGITAITIQDGNLFGFSGAAEATTVNPPEETQLFTISGGILTEKHSESYVGEGILFTVETVIEKNVYSYVGSGDLFGFNNLEEARTYVYDCESIVEYRYLDYGLLVIRNNVTITTLNNITISSDTTAPTGGIRVENGSVVSIAPGITYTVPNQLATPQYTEDYGLVSELHDPVRDYGWILGTIQDGMPGCIYGQIDVTGSAVDKFTPSWIGSGNIGIAGQARVPLDVAVYGTGFIKNLGGAAETSAIAEESTGLFKITGTPIVGITAITINDGSLFGFSGAAEATSVNPPDITTDLKITGTAGDPLLTHREIASGNLFAFSGGQERNSFDYAGTGTITLLPRKPETYELSELANYTLEDYTTCSPYISLSDTSFYNGHTKLGCVQLKWLNSEESHEKHTEVYDIHLCNDEPEIDYGYIVNSDVVACVDVAGTINSNTSASTGCTRVAPGTILAIEPGFTYNIQPQITQASAFEDYGFINEIYNPTRDYGWILDTTGLVCPFGNLATLNGVADQAYVRNTEGFAEGGTIRFASDVSAEIFFTPPYIVEGYIGVVYGDGITVFSLLHNGSGNLSYFGGSAETVAWSPDEEQLLFSIRGAAVPIFSLAHYGSGTIIVTEGDERARVLAPPAGGSISDINGEADVAFSANPPEEEPLFRFVGNKEESFSFGTYVGDGDLFSIGGSSELLGFAEQPTIDIRIIGQLTERRTNKFRGSGGLFAFIGSAESRTIDLPAFRADLKFFGGITSEIFSANPPENGTEIKISGTTTPEILTFSERFFGTIFTSGESTNVYVPNHIGTGSLFAFAGSAESAGFNPTDITTDLRITGFAIETFTANPPEDGTKIILSGTTSPEIRSFAEQPFGTFSIFGDADTDRSRIFVGSGSLKKFSGSSESATFNPEERDLLFSFTGGITSEKHTEAYAGVDTPIRIRRGALSDFQTYDYQPLWTGFGIVTITGESADRFLKNNVGSGNIFNIGGASESATFNPTEEQMLFSFTGELSERTTSSYYGEGSLFGINGSTESSTVVPPVSADIRFFGESSSKFIINNVGFGNIFNIGGASESVSFNPDERQILFSFSGFASQSLGIAETKQIEIDITGDSYDLRSRSYVGSGSATIFGESANRFVINNIGFGNIFNIGGASESATFNPTEEQMLFSLTGELAERTLVREISQGGTLTVSGSSVVRASIAETKQIEVDITGEAYITASLLHVGSGNLFAFSGGAESVTGVPPTEKALFRISGIATEKNTENYVGSGSLRKLSGAAESVAFNPDEQQILFTFTGTRNSEKRTSREISKGGTFQISGESVSKYSSVYYGQGTIPVDGDAHTTRARDFIGFGTIPVFRGAAESLTFNPDERDLLFSFNGERISEKSTFREVGTLGKVRITGTSGDPLLTFAENPFVKINVSGNSIDVRSRRYVGSGRLFSFSNAKEIFARAQYEGSGIIDINGNAIIQVELFQPPRTFVWII